MAKKRARRRKASWVTKGRKIAAALIGVSPVINSARQRLPSGDIEGFSGDIMEMYTGFDREGNFAFERLVRGYAPLAGAYAFNKVLAYLLRGI